VAFARDLNSDLDVVRLSQRLVARIVETLVVDRMALMLRRDERRAATSRRSATTGSRSRCRAVARLVVDARLDAAIRRARRPDRGARFAAEEVEFWRDAGIYYFVPCVFEGARSPCWRSAARKPTSRSTARTSAC
jgi:hypothetical protein